MGLASLLAALRTQGQRATHGLVYRLQRQSRKTCDVRSPAAHDITVSALEAMLHQCGQSLLWHEPFSGLFLGHGGSVVLVPSILMFRKTGPCPLNATEYFLSDAVPTTVVDNFAVTEDSNSSCAGSRTIYVRCTGRVVGFCWNHFGWLADLTVSGDAFPEWADPAFVKGYLRGVRLRRFWSSLARCFFLA
jgi:hypothetical protein